MKSDSIVSLIAGIGTLMAGVYIIYKAINSDRK